MARQGSIGGGEGTAARDGGSGGRRRARWGALGRAATGVALVTAAVALVPAVWVATAVVGVGGGLAPAGATQPPSLVVVGNTRTHTVTSYRPPASGNTKPVLPTLHLGTGTNATSLAFDADGNLWIAEGLSGTVAEFSDQKFSTGGSPAPTVVFTMGTAASGLAFDGQGNLWITEDGVDKVVEIPAADLATGGTPTLAVTLTSLAATHVTAAPCGIAFDPTGNMWISSNATDSFFVFELTRAEFATSGSPAPHVALFPKTTKVLQGPEGLAFDASGDLWVTGTTDSTTGTTLVEFTPSQLATGGKLVPNRRMVDSGPFFAAGFDHEGDLWGDRPGDDDTLVEYTASQLAAGGTQTPITVSGPTTGLTTSRGLAVVTSPTVASVTPPNGTKGTVVTVHGTGFTSAMKVEFAGVVATTVHVVSPFTLTAVAPAGTGTVTVVVTTWSGFSTNPATDHFTYGSGYDLVGSDGGVFVFDATGQTGGFFGSLPGIHVTPAAPIVGLVPTLSDQGYFLVGDDGGVFAFGTAPFLGSLPGKHVVPSAPIVGIVAADTDRGYFLVGRDGGVFAFGTVPFLGSLPGKGISVDNVIGIAATPSGGGYWVVTATGTVYAFGSAKQLGTAKGLSSPVSAIAGTPTGGGYWITTQNGTVKTFGNAAAHGTLPALGVTPTEPVIGIVHTAGTGGYWLIGADGGIFAFGNAGFVGSLPGDGVHVTDIVGAVPN